MEDKPDKPKTIIRTVNGPPFETVLPNGQKSTVATEANAVYVEDDADVDTLIKLLASGRQIVGILDLHEKKVVLTMSVNPTKVSGATPFSDKAKGLLA